MIIIRGSELFEITNPDVVVLVVSGNARQGLEVG